MSSTPSYRKAFKFALILHVALIAVLMTESMTNKRPALTMEAKNTPGIEQPTAAQPEIVKAVSVNSEEVMQTVNRLKQERVEQQRAEVNRQKELNRQVEQAKQQKVKEQQEIARLKQEANTIALARKKQVEEEQKHLKELAEQKRVEAQNIAKLKQEKEKLQKQKELEAKKLAELNKKKLAENEKAEKLKLEQAKANKLKAEQAKASAQAKADLERKQQADAAAAQQAQAARNAENQARMAGEVDKYKALILNAIGRKWILPENADSSLSSQFRIRLAPDGTILEVSLTRGSGDPILDRSAETAIYKAQPLPVPTDAETFNMFRDINLTVRPEQIRG
ncbi:MAG: cell envelope integrity protein TolA [Legionella sp.]|nr:MAG: cell envelope integrity protein TolA [Legionella sp.]